MGAEIHDLNEEAIRRRAGDQVRQLREAGELRAWLTQGHSLTPTGSLPGARSAYAPDMDAIENAEDRFRAGLVLGRKLERQDAGRLVRETEGQAHGRTGLFTVIAMAAIAVVVFCAQVMS